MYAWYCWCYSQSVCLEAGDQHRLSAAKNTCLTFIVLTDRGITYPPTLSQSTESRVNVMPPHMAVTMVVDWCVVTANIGTAVLMLTAVALVGSHLIHGSWPAAISGLSIVNLYAVGWPADASQDGDMQHQQQTVLLSLQLTGKICGRMRRLGTMMVNCSVVIVTSPRFRIS